MFSFPLIILTVSTLVLANPFPQGSNDLNDIEQYVAATIINTDLSRPDLENEDLESSPSLDMLTAEKLVKETNPSSSCTLGFSPDVSNGNNIVKRKANSCPTGQEPDSPHWMRIEKNTPLLKGPQVVESGYMRYLRESVPDGVPPATSYKTDNDKPCAGNQNRPHHVTCGGPMIDAAKFIVGIVLNCVISKFFKLLFSCSIYPYLQR